MSENIRHHRSGFLAPGAERLRGVADRLHGRFQRCVQHVIALLAEALWLHAAAKQVEAKIEVSRIVGIIAKESRRRSPQPIGRGLSARDRAAYCLPKICQRTSQNLRVDRFLGFEMKIERRVRVARNGGDREQRRSVPTYSLENLPCRVQNQLALEVAYSLLPADFPLFRHLDSSNSTLDR